MAARSQRTEVAADRALLEIARIGFSDLRRLFHQDGRLKHPHEWDDDTAASIASVEIVTRNLGDGEVEHVHRIKLWDKGKALEQLSRHLGLYHDQVPSEQGRDRPLTDLTDEELYQRLLDARVRLNRAIEHEQGMRCGTRLLEGSKPSTRPDTGQRPGDQRHQEVLVLSLPFPGKNTAHVAFGDAQLTGDGASGLLGVGGSSGDDLALGQPLDRGRTAQPYALGAGAGETGMDALLNDRALKLSEHAEHLKQGAAGRRRGIDTLHMQIEIDAVGADLVEERYEVLKRAAQPVNGPGHEHVEFAARGVFEQAIELGALVTAFGAAHAVVDILVDDLPALARQRPRTRAWIWFSGVWPLRVDTRA